MSQNTNFSSEILELFPGPLFIIDIIGKVIEHNQSAKVLLPNFSEKTESFNFLSLLQETQKQEFLNFLKNVSNLSKEASFEFYLKGKGGNYHRTIINAKKIQTYKDNVDLITLALSDITFQDMQSIFIKESQARFESIANYAPVMIWIADVDGLFSFVNKVWCEFTGRNIGNELGLNWLQNAHPDDIRELIQTYQTSLKTRSNFTHQFRLKNKELKYKWIMMVGTPRFDEKNKFSGLIGTCSDISVQKETEVKIKEINKELTDINATKDKFFSIISHDLRSPLFGLTGLLEMISDGDSKIEKRNKDELMHDALLSAKNIYQLMENLLEWSQIQTGNIEFNPQTIPLYSLVNNVVSIYQQNLKSKNIKLDIEVDLNLLVFADKKITETILRNLLSNAIKFTPANGSIKISAIVRKDEIVLSVKDDGIGMNDEQLDKLFKIEFARSTKGTAEEKGTGLGLILCKELIEKQNGQIWAESKLNSGSSFSFTLKSNDVIY
jgi:two-component system sensor histidine kinase/response regulator